jgi:hypothetical protein
MTRSERRRSATGEPGGSPDQRRDVETLLDQMLAESFPASDPPTWDTATERIEKMGVSR